MRCELCGQVLDEATMVSHGEFFVCEDCDDVSAADAALGDETMPLDQVASELATKH